MPQDEKRVIGAIDWLVFNPSQRIEAIKQANGIIRNFLGKRLSLFFGTINSLFSYHIIRTS